MADDKARLAPDDELAQASTAPTAGYPRLERRPSAEGRQIAKELTRLSLETTPSFGRSVFNDTTEARQRRGTSEIEGLYDHDWSELPADANKRRSVIKRVRVVSPRRSQTPPPGSLSARSSNCTDDSGSRDRSPAPSEAATDGSLWATYAPTRSSLTWLGFSAPENGGQASEASSSARSSLQIPETSDEPDPFELLRGEVRSVFLDFLEEVEAASWQRFGGEERDDSDAPEGHELSRALEAQPFLTRLVKCQEAVRKELQGDELILWNHFILEDLELQGTLELGSENLERVLLAVADSQSEAEGWMTQLEEMVAGDATVTLVDILSWWAEVSPQRSRASTFRRSLSSFGIMSGFVSLEADATPGGSLSKALDERGLAMTTKELGASLREYERTLVDLAGYKCELNLLTTWSSSTPTMGIDVLQKLVRLIHGMLTPTERVLWAKFGDVDEDFDGAYTLEEALAGVGDIVALTEEEEQEDGNEDELTELRSNILREAVEELFSSRAIAWHGTVSLSDLLTWWWNLSNDFRAASGLNITPASLKQSYVTDPEGMFSAQLRRVGRDGDRKPGLGIAIRGHARLLAELSVRGLRGSFQEMWGSEREEEESSSRSSEEEPSEEGSEDDAHSAPDTGVKAPVFQGGPPSTNGLKSILKTSTPTSENSF